MPNTQKTFPHPDERGKSRNVILDEFGYYFSTISGYLESKVRDVNCIPKSTYLVTDDGVFVFKKLIFLIKKEMAKNPSVNIEDTAKQLLNQAIVTASEAVDIWGACPEQYIISGDRIIHQHFNAVIPGIFETKESKIKAIAKLLQGHVIEGEGEFTYREQPMRQLAPLELIVLPPKPALKECLDLEILPYRLNYKDGYPPLNEALFNNFKDAIQHWVAEQIAVRKKAESALNYSGFKLTDGEVDSLNNIYSNELYFDKENADELKMLYPELSSLSDVAIYGLFDDYKDDAGITRYSPFREIDFFFYLICRLYDVNSSGCSGCWMYCALMEGADAGQVAEIGNAAFKYSNTICNIERKISAIIGFMSNPREGKLMGLEIFTMHDFMKMAQGCWRQE
ncbi:hypothetical protein [Aeromonas sp. MrichA-1]|uniref:hypothetical protein n=1 Tax=Aeromonas sp. MrichA-1 TaxID=2823362 RepID=UPI001B34081A|nr:hypothetical protein [Aeromonas sp. MrichA-1]MBP4081824.1 hypothetical protein [Aeromonas sp. MrichA-1]